MKSNVGSLMNCLTCILPEPKFLMSVIGILTIAQLIVGIATLVIFVNEIYAWYEVSMLSKHAWVFLGVVIAFVIGTFLVCITLLLNKTIFEVLYHLGASIVLCYATCMFQNKPCNAIGPTTAKVADVLGEDEPMPSFEKAITMGFVYAGAHFLGALWSFISYRRK